MRSGTPMAVKKRDSSAATAGENDWRIYRWAAPGTPGAMELDAGATVTNAPAVGQLHRPGLAEVNGDVDRLDQGLHTSMHAAL